MTHHANDGSASRIHRSLIRQHGYCNDPSPLLAAAAAIRERCEQGEHTPVVAEARRVTYIGYGRRVEPGTRYCCYCKTILESS